jgi:hypothetical protein
MTDKGKSVGEAFRSSAASTLAHRRASSQTQGEASSSGRVTTHTRRVVYQAAKPARKATADAVSRPTPVTKPPPKRPRDEGDRAGEAPDRSKGGARKGREAVAREGEVKGNTLPYVERHATGPAVWWPTPDMVAAPLTFRTVAEYQQVYEPLFLEEMREGLRSGALLLYHGCVARHLRLGFAGAAARWWLTYAGGVTRSVP